MAQAKSIEFTVTTPGKIILCGEHAVVYDKLALAASIDLLTEIKVAVHHKPLITIYLDTLEYQWSVSPDVLLSQVSASSSLNHDLNQLNPQLVDHLKLIIPDGNPAVRASLLCICYLYCSVVGRPVGFDLRIGSAIPVGAGCGSSAALSVAVSAAFHVLHHLASNSNDQYVRNDTAINQWAFQCERIFHATPSGIDNAVCTYGGIVKYQKKKVVESVVIPEARILLINTQVSRQTKLLVQSVRHRCNRFPTVVDPILQAIDQLSHQLAEIIQQPPENNYKSIQELVTMNQCLLASLGVSHPTLDHIHSVAKDHGQAAKLTGAGGGGMAFVWLDPLCTQQQLDTLLLEMKQANYICWPVRLGVKGLNITFA